jgi:transposase
MVFRTRDLFVRQRTQSINTLRTHLAEHGIVAPQEALNLPGIGRLIHQAGDDIEPLVIETSRLYLAQIAALSDQVNVLEAVLKKEAAQSDASSRLMTMPGLGPITAMAIEAFAPALRVFQKSRDFAACLAGACATSTFQRGGNRCWGAPVNCH